jgi:hypothetical protein
MSMAIVLATRRGSLESGNLDFGALGDARQNLVACVALKLARVKSMNRWFLVWIGRPSANC